MEKKLLLFGLAALAVGFLLRTTLNTVPVLRNVYNAGNPS